MSIPPDAPKEGTKSNASKPRGQTFLRKVKSKSSFLVSWKHTTSQFDAPISGGVNPTHIPTHHIPSSARILIHVKDLKYQEFGESGT
jgi:hypothetical protein